MATIGPIDFRGGLSHGYDFTSLPQGKGYSTRMQGCYVKGGVVVPRWNFSILNSAVIGSGNLIKGLTVWNDTANSVKTVVATAGTKIYTSADISAYQPQSAATIVFTDRTGAITIANGVGYTFDSLNNILVVAGNSSNSIPPNKITAYNANAVALGGSPPNADCVKQVNNFLFLARNLSSTTTQSTVYWSNVNDPETWTGTNVLNFSKNDGEPIMALGSIGTDLYIFKQNSIGRLSTVTLTTSGAVTLGPLSTVIKGVGCCGPRALDNLPNGNIVFVGFDGHFYEFDGSTVLDRSKQPYPGPNVYDTGNQAVINQQEYLGMGFCSADTNVSVKTIRGNNEVWVSFTKSIYLNLGNPICFIYNFERNIWVDNPSASVCQIFSMAELPISALNNYVYPVESSSALLFGGSVSSLSLSVQIFASGNSQIPYSNGATRLSTIVKLMGEDGPLIPRSLCLEVDCPPVTTGATLSNFNITVLFDGWTGVGTSIYTNTNTTVPNRIIANIPFTTDTTGTNIFPTFMCVQINIAFTGSGAVQNVFSDVIRIGNMYISDEVIR